MRLPHLPLVLALTVALAGCTGVPPELSPISDQVVAVGGELRLDLTGTTEDGRGLTYYFTTNMPNADKRASLAQRPDGTGLFILRPQATEVGTWAYDFTASDGGMSSTLTVQIEVRSAIGEATLPVFRHPLGQGTMLDLRTQSCVELEIMVDDADSTSVTIAQEEPRIEGATLTPGQRKTATWKWCPTPAQKEADDRYLLRLSADDGENPKRTINYAIVLRRPVGAGCAGTPPQITHTPASDETLVAVDVIARVDDDVGLKSAPLIYYGTTHPGASPNLGKLVADGLLYQSEMALIAGSGKSGTYKAQLPNPVADKPAGASAKLYYVITATDSDDPKGSCDKFTESRVYEMTVTNPGGQGNLGLCEECTHDVQCGGGGDLCVRIGEAGDGYCARACTAAGECPSGYSCSEDPVRSVGGIKARQCVPVAGTCNAAVASCTDDAREPNDTRAEGLAQPALTPGTHANLVSCPSYGSFSDEDWYKIELTTDSKVSLSLVGTRASDLDLDLFKADGTFVATSKGPESEEGIVKALVKGTYVVRAKARAILGKTRVERNPYTLTYATAAPCVDDMYEDDDTIAQARPQPALWGFTITNNQICSGDDDVFKVQAAVGETIMIDLRFTQTKPTENLNLHFLDASGVDLTPCSEAMPQTCSSFSGQSNDSNEYFEYTVPVEDNCTNRLCTYYIVVRGFGGSENRYDIRIDKAR
jgi:hypothetical protein